VVAADQRDIAGFIKDDTLSPLLSRWVSNAGAVSANRH
jgi:hypothetical protein